MSIFNELPDEFTGAFYQTEPLSLTPHRIQNLKIVASAIGTHFINKPYWEFECQEGSLTFRYHFHENCDSCKKDQYKVIKIFVDVDKKMAIKEGVDSFVGVDPIAVAIELGYEDPFVRKNIRDFLRNHSRNIYLDPVKGHSKYRLNPSEHYYDIVFLGEGTCEYPIDDKLFKEISDEIDSKIGQEKSNGFIFKE